MVDSPRVKIVTYVPFDDADKVRTALGQAGAGEIGEYSYCSYSAIGTGRFVPSDKASSQGPGRDWRRFRGLGHSGVRRPNCLGSPLHSMAPFAAVGVASRHFQKVTSIEWLL